MTGVGLQLAVFDGNSWSCAEPWFIPADPTAPVPAALRVYDDALHCVVVRRGRLALDKYEFARGGSWGRGERIEPPGGAVLLNGVALTGPDLYVEAELVDGRVGLYATPVNATTNWEPVVEPTRVGEGTGLSCRERVTGACAGLPKPGGAEPGISELRSRATMTAYRGKVWCAYDTGAANNPLYWQTYVASTWSPPYRFGGTTRGLDPALCVYGDLLYCFHRAEDGVRLRWSATNSLGWSAAHDTPMKALSTPAVRAFQGALYCVYLAAEPLSDEPAG
ncbi:hypothetical protein [Saccharothrix syringae]|uniref:Uncharacterized protein n=1 Tax=Saccharothrix syringae TaxID=103733 RepID=A0A5Q0GXM6_SACSY|nr:hypothetical protein [Saccharothrix syringae]QFZ18643.1 hypothetical protein EKG83_15285 [Saccharothrix syringae]